MRIGFTGTREGMSGQQWTAIGDWLDANASDSVGNEAHHGACIGADERFHIIARHRLMIRHIHPSNLPKSVQGWCDKGDEDVVYDPKPPLDRNRDIVDAADVLLACPNGREVQRSGTWATIRYALRRGKPVVIFWPDGSVENLQ